MKSVIKGFFIRHFAAFLIGALIVAAFLTTGGMIRSIKNNVDEFGLITSPVGITADEAVAVAADEQYIVREFEGRIGVFVPGDSQPERVVQVYVMHLPESDRALLRTGITVNGKGELETLLDDFRS